MNIMIMAGGTGGHVFPALAVAQQLREQGHSVTWMGAPNSFESQRVPEAGFAIETITVAGVRGKGAATLLTAPWAIARAVWQARAILAKVKPQVVLGMGGFAAGPGGLAAWLSRIPLVIHEQNAAAGLTNRLLARLAHSTLQAFPNTLPGASTVGNPVRDGFMALPSPELRQRPTGRTRLLIVGGSQGARALNQWVPKALAQLPPQDRPQVLHQAGRTLPVAEAAYAEAGVAAEVTAFISDMPAAYGSADMVICRAGASTIAELCAAGVPSILVPFPAAVDDHQTANARYLSDSQAAVLMPEAELTADRLAGEILRLCNHREQRVAMADAARAKAWHSAVPQITACLLAAGAAP